jgi:protocatechuate 3,4-dioxygenase beta subunit
VRWIACVFSVCLALCAPTLAQTARFIVAEYLAPQFTAPEDAPPLIVVAGKDEPGVRMIVTGRTLVGDKPVPGVSLYVFHTDAKGNYSNTTFDNTVAELNPRLHGALRTDAQGKYRYETTRPGSYDNGPAHVHYVVKAEGYEPLLVALQFQDDPIVVARQKFSIPLFDPLAFKNGPCQSRPDCVLTQPVTRDAQGVLHVIRDVQMVKKI